MPCAIRPCLVLWKMIFYFAWVIFLWPAFFRTPVLSIFSQQVFLTAFNDSHWVNLEKHVFIRIVLTDPSTSEKNSVPLLTINPITINTTHGNLISGVCYCKLTFKLLFKAHRHWLHREIIHWFSTKLTGFILTKSFFVISTNFQKKRGEFAAECFFELIWLLQIAYENLTHVFLFWAKKSIARYSLL